jgi:hypothetical protein
MHPQLIYQKGMKYISSQELRAQKALVEQLWSSRCVKGFCYTEHVKNILLRAFDADRSMSGRSRVLSKETGLREAQVQQWFNNQRKRH